MTASSKIIELRELLAAKHPPAPPTDGRRFPTSLERVDTVLGGGLPHGGTVEVVCQGSGGGLLLASLIGSTLESRSLIALIDGADSFDFTGVPKAALPGLLWVRGRSAAQAVQAADLLLRDGNLGLVVMDLRSNDAREVARVPASGWHRLQRVVEPSTTAFLVLTRQPTVSAARLRLQLDARFTLDACQRRQRNLMATLHVSQAHRGRGTRAALRLKTRVPATRHVRGHPAPQLRLAGYPSHLGEHEEEPAAVLSDEANTKPVGWQVNVPG